MILEKETIVKTIKKSVYSSFVGAILILIFAIILLRNPENFLTVAITIFGYGAVFVGVLDVVLFFRTSKDQKFLQKKLMTGILLICFGIISFFQNSLIKDLATFLLGGYFLYLNANRFELSFLLKEYTNQLWMYLLALSSINIIISLFLIINPFNQMVSENVYLASLIIASEVLFLIQNGILSIGLSSSKKNNKEKNEIVKEK